MLWNLNSIPHKKNQLSTLINKKVWKSVQSPRCAVVKCALCSDVRSDLSARFKRPRKNKLMLRVSLKLLKNWRNGSQITPPAFLSIAPFKIFCKFTFILEMRKFDVWFYWTINLNSRLKFNGLVILSILMWLNCLQMFASYSKAKVKIQIHMMKI